MSKHTPGPWEATKGYTPLVMAGETLICTPSARRDGIGGMQLSEVDGNANLIAAAPELLAALERLIADISPDSAEVWRQAFDAVAKARGETP
jgi:hypothetical protein